MNKYFNHTLEYQTLIIASVSQAFSFHAIKHLDNWTLGPFYNNFLIFPLFVDLKIIYGGNLTPSAVMVSKTVK